MGKKGSVCVAKRKHLTPQQETAQHLSSARRLYFMMCDVSQRIRSCEASILNPGSKTFFLCYYFSAVSDAPEIREGGGGGGHVTATKFKTMQIIFLLKAV